MPSVVFSFWTRIFMIFIFLMTVYMLNLSLVQIQTHFQLWCRSDAWPHVYAYQDIFAHISCSPVFPNNMSVPTDHQINYWFILSASSHFVFKMTQAYLWHTHYLYTTNIISFILSMISQITRTIHNTKKPVPPTVINLVK